MTGFVDPVTPRAEPSGTEAARMERVLDAAGALLVRRGYRGVTVEDVAREAGVGKGTVYLHVRTKDALLLTVLLRSQRRAFAELADRMEAEPAVALPWRMTRVLYDRLRSDEVARALYLGDPEVLGRLAHEAADTLGELAARRTTAVREHFRILRAAGLVGTAEPADEQLHTWGAVAYGFFATSGLPRPADPLPPPGPQRCGELLETALHRVLAGTAPESGAGRVAREVAGLYRPLVDHIDAEWRRRIR